MPSRCHLCVSALVCASVLPAIALLPACEEPTTSTSTQTAAVSVETPRVAALLPFAADQLIALGVEPVLVPALQGGQPESWDGIQVGALDHSVGPNLEQLIAADPDYIISSSTYTRFFEQMEKSTGAKVVIMDVDSLDHVRSQTTALGEIVGKQAEAAAWIESYNAEIESAKPADISEDPPSVLAIFGTPHAFFTFLPQSYLGDLVQQAGARLMTSDLPEMRVYRGLSPLSMEVVIDKDPDVLLVIFHGPQEAAKAMLDGDPLWAELTAVKNNNVAFLSDDLYAMRSGSQAPLALEQLRQAIAEARSTD